MLLEMKNAQVLLANYGSRSHQNEGPITQDAFQCPLQLELSLPLQLPFFAFLSTLCHASQAPAVLERLLLPSTCHFFCVRYLLPLNENAKALQLKTQAFIIAVSFQGSGIQEWPSWVGLARGLS